MTPKLKEHLEKQPRGRIYHYSSPKGMLGILCSREMWATKIQFMNDAEEFKHAITLAMEVLTRRKRDIGQTEVIDSIIKNLSALDATHIFLACFSEEGDLLSQWRGYCPDGIGFSLGFRYDSLSTVVSSQDCFVAQCIYEHKKKLSLLEEIIDDLLAQTCGEKVEGDNPLYLEFVLNFWVLAPLLKSPSFQEEKEWRVVTFPKSLEHPLVSARDRKSTLIPYFRMKLETLKDSALKDLEIIASPNPNMELALAGAAAFLTTQKIAGAVKASSVPYRGL